jgi:GntR family transcriptional regulator
MDAMPVSARPRKSTIPRYYAVWRTLWSRITSGQYPAGSLIGTEVSLAAEFDVSRVTLREALSLLEQDGLVERRRSLGTFVAPDVIPRGVVEFTGYLEDVILQADLAHTTHFERMRVPAPETVAEALDIADGSPVIRVQRLRVASGEPRMWLVDYMLEAVGADFTDDEIRGGSLIRRLDENDATRIEYGHQSISARIGSDEVCARLGIDAGSPVLYSNRTLYGAGGRPVSYAEIFYPGSRFAFEIRLGRV